MPRHTLQLLVLLSVSVVAPASAAHLGDFAGDSASGCPHERAELATAGYEPVDQSAVGDPADGSLFDPGRRSAFLP